MPSTFRLYSSTAASMPVLGQMESTSTQRPASEAIAPLIPSSGIRSIADGLPSSASSCSDDAVRYPDAMCAAPRLDVQGVAALGERRLPAPRPVLLGVRSRANDTPLRVGERDRALWIMLRRGERERWRRLLLLLLLPPLVVSSSFLGRDLDLSRFLLDDFLAVLATLSLLADAFVRRPRLMLVPPVVLDEDGFSFSSVSYTHLTLPTKA